MSKYINESERRKTERRRAKRRLIDENSVEILESMSDGFVAVDREWRYTYVNRAAERNARLRREEMLGRSVWELFPENSPEFERAFHRAMDEGVTVHFEEYCAPLDRWFEQTVYPASEGITAYARDVTERKHAEDALRQAQKRIESILNSVADTHILFDRDWRYLYVNEAAVRAMGRPREQILGRTLWEIYPDIVGTELDRQYHRAMDERIFVACDFHYLTLDTWWENRFYPAQEGLSVFATDITARKRAEEELRKQNEVLRTIIDNIPVMIRFLGPDARAQLVNRTWEQTLGWSLEEVQLRTFDLFNDLYPDPRERQRALDFVAAATGEWADFRIRVRDGRMIDATFANIRLSDGTNISIGQDITERKQAEEVLRRSHEELEQRVVERTRQLSEINEELMLEIAERARAEEAATAAKEEAERRAREAEEGQSILHTILEYVPAGITMTGGPPDFPIITNSRYAERLLGREPSQLVNISAGLHTEAFGLWMADGLTRPRPEQLPLYRAAHHGEVIVDEEWIIERPDGSRICELFNVAPVRDSEGRITGAINCWRDITERKRAELLLRESYDRVEMILDSITDKFFAFDSEWRYMYFNKHAEENLKALGKDPASLIGKTLWEEFPNPPAEESYRRAMSERVTLTHEHYYRPLKEWVENRIYPTPGGGLAIFLRYVTERKRTETELRRSEAYLAEGQRLSHIGSWGWNVATGELFWSREQFRIFGFDPEGSPPSISGAVNMIHPDDRSFIERTLARAVREMTDSECDCRIVSRDGAIKHVHITAHPVFNDSGDLIEYLGTTGDITERVRAEEERTQLLRRVINAQEEERRRIAREMHDQFGQQLSALNMKIGAIKSEYGEQEGLGEQLHDLGTIAKGLDRDVDFLVWEMRPTALDDIGLVAALSDYVKRWSKHFGIDAEMLSIGMERNRLTGEIESMLYRITQEALTNIAKHAEAENVSVLLERRSDHVSLIIEDDGRGFDAEQAFTERKGLGLVGMRERAILVGGMLQIDSEAGRGTTFVIRIPVPYAPPEEEQHG